MNDSNLMVILTDVVEYLKKIRNGHWNIPTQMTDEADDLIYRIQKELDE